jgi:hypothetical protein
MADATVAVHFAADIDDLVAGVGEAREALASFAPSFAELNGQANTLSASLSATFDPGRLQPYNNALMTSAAIERSLAAAQAEAAQAIKAANADASEDSVRAAREAVSGEVAAIADGTRQALALYADETRQHEISIEQGLAASKQALGEELAAQVAALQQEGTLGEQTLAQKMRIDEQILADERRNQDEIVALTRKAVDEQAQQYQQLAGTVMQAFNSQLHGLLSGTENWSTAFKNVLEDLLIKFIEWGEATVVRQVATEAAQTAATTAGVTARTAAEQSGAVASLATQAATMVRSILSSAAEAFAGVFGFLSPIMGPFAAGPAAAAQATVASMAGAVASADIGMWRVPDDMLTLVHHNELIMPTAQADAFRDLLAGGAPSAGAQGAVHIHPTTNFHVSAVDSGSVAQWMRGNSATMMKAIDEAVRHGAHLGLRRLGG